MNNTDSAQYRQQNPIGYSIAQILNVVQCGVGGLILVINLAFLTVLTFGRWRLQRPKRYALSANLALADVISGLVLMSLALTVLFEWYGGTMIYMLLETAMSASFAMCTMCYDAILRIQYIAVNRPVRYFLYLTTTRLFFVVASIWTIAHAYAFGKGYVLFFQTSKHVYYLAVAELAIMGLGWLINFVVYLYVLRQAMKKVKTSYESKNRQATSRLIKKNQKETLDEDEDDPRLCGTPQSEYAFLITVGLNLFIFFLSYGPLWVNWALALYWNEEMYFEQRSMVTRHLLLLLCFVRGIFEPIVHILRQPKLMCGNQYSDSRD